MLWAIAILTVFAVIGGINYYISRRAYQGLAAVFPHIRFGIVLAVFLILAACMVLGFMRSRLPLPAGVQQTLGTVSAYWMGIFVYLLLFTLAADVLVLVLRLCRVSFVKLPACRLYCLIAVLVLTCSTVFYGIHHARQIKHVSYEISLPGKTDVSDMNIVMISDLHLGAVGSESRLETIVNEINRLEPDIVCIAGDFFDTDYTEIREPEKAIRTLRRIRSTYGTYACLGNHDAGQTLNDMRAFLEACGIRALNDAYTVIDERLVLVGRLDAAPIGSYAGLKRKALEEFFVRENAALPVIVMDHNPANIEEYTHAADLILSGHTHKGQIFPGSLITDLLYTVDHGHYQKDPDSPHVVVTSGVGYWGLPMRVGTDSEIVRIVITH